MRTRITAAVSVLPCTTRTLRSGCRSTKSVPPPLSASFLLSAARLSTLTPILSALRMASSIWRLMPSFMGGMKYWKL